MTGKIAGLGNGEYTIEIEAEGHFSGTCRNTGGNEAPGINKKLDVTGSTTFEITRTDRNGHYLISVESDEPALPTAKEVCPNGNWTLVRHDVSFTS